MQVGLNEVIVPHRQRNLRSLVIPRLFHRFIEILPCNSAAKSVYLHIWCGVRIALRMMSSWKCMRDSEIRKLVCICLRRSRYRIWWENATLHLEQQYISPCHYQTGLIPCQINFKQLIKVGFHSNFAMTELISSNCQRNNLVYTFHYFFSHFCWRFSARELVASSECAFNDWERIFYGIEIRGIWRKEFELASVVFNHILISISICKTFNRL